LSYDALNRLKTWKIFHGSSLQRTDSIVYNSTSGNIQSKSDLGNYAMNYGANGKPHALTSISGVPASFSQPTIAYPTALLDVTYTDFKKIKTLSEMGKTYALSYGVDEQRTKSVYKIDNVVQLTRYYLGNYEEEVSPNGNIRKIHYLPNAVYIQNNGKDSLLFMHKDHLGSLVALTDYSGNVLERYAYDPWGNRRNPNNWTQKDTRTSWRLNRGFTMHEHLDAFAIINMNGRVYDPLTSQFFSPDPRLQAPGDWLNYNRYAYALNCPTMFIDPDGEFFLFAIFFGAIINTTIQAISGNLGGMKSFWTAMGIGALSGAAGYGASALMSSVVGTVGIIGGGLTGAAGGTAGGFVGGAGNAWANGANFNQGLKAGLTGAGYGALMGGALGAISGGITAYKHEGNLLTGKGATFDQIASTTPSSNKVEIGEGMTYSNEYAKGFSDTNFGENIKGLDNLYADGSLPSFNYTRNGDLVLNKNGVTVNGSTRYNGVGRGSDVYLYKSAFVSPKQLYVTMGHEYIHVAINASPYHLTGDQHEHIAYSWGEKQWAAFGRHVPNPISSFHKLFFLDYTKFQINNYFPNIVFP